MTKSLPEAISLEHLKKEAKALLRRHQNGDKSVCLVLRQLHRFAEKTDEDILASPIKLAEIQFALAMEYGFKSWRDLKEHVEKSRPVAEVLVPHDGPIYTSPRTARSLRQEYRIYSDRLELRCRVRFGTIVILATDIVAIEVRPPIVIADMLRGKSFVKSFPLKVDLSDGFRHVAVERKSGRIKHIRFTPDDPNKFVEACKTIM